MMSMINIINVFNIVKLSSILLDLLMFDHCKPTPATSQQTN